jgi:ligand-binding sensor domain-containing protein
MTENQINCLLVDSQRGLWVGTNWGLFLKNSSGWQDYTSFIGNPQVRALSLDNNGDLWIGTLSGLTVWKNEEWTTYNNQNSIINNQINDIIFDKNNTAYIATIDGLFSIKDELSLVVDTSSLDNTFINIRSLSFANDSLIIGTVNGGLAYYYNEEISWYNNSNSGLNDNTINDIGVDENINVWIAAPFGGLMSHLKNQSWLIYNTTTTNNWPTNGLNSILMDEQNFMFIGSNGGGFFRFYLSNGLAMTETYNTSNSILPSNYVFCMAKDEQDYWIGTEQGLVRWGNSVNIEEKEMPGFQKINNYIYLNTASKIELFSIGGKKLIEKTSDFLDLKNFSNGIYLLKINNQNFKINNIN